MSSSSPEWAGRRVVRDPGRVRSGKSSSGELGEFLRSRRAAVTPRDLGIRPSYGDRRRVPGLRREELAELVGVSTTYYTRLERGESHQVSDAILDALARVLNLSPDERAHLYRLARALPPVRGTGHEDRVREPIRDLIAGSRGAVVLVGRRTDILAGNPLGYALWTLTSDEIAAIGTPEPPNQARRVFLDPAARELFADWERQAEDLASYLRVATAERPDDLALHQLVAELATGSADFARLWRDHPVRDCLHTVRRYRHPLVGELELNEEILRLPDDPGQRLIISAAQAGTPSADRLALLGSATAG
ncbi:helix-turn-helix domain-containing protein [Amycolatopsis thermophila]|uniref:Transcriptional regulator with XRE-family HTH domain n=1 Tax=Amycolatopsis thermophila TaxID=206084 RepID=A0ABU0F166_9PSEU|nr:helix-turn-helix transcriptional regulator [Amycolatopsis thermophila]MDQ0381318.1 transcriptional regulator with XRE-family HTH domain [Amycolatopsis thermophila]